MIYALPALKNKKNPWRQFARWKGEKKMLEGSKDQRRGASWGTFAGKARKSNSKSAKNSFRTGKCIRNVYTEGRGDLHELKSKGNGA